MTTTERNPTEVAECGCPYDPEYDEGSLGWHLPENHIPETIWGLKRDLGHMQRELAHLEEALQRKYGETFGHLSGTTSL